MASVGSEETNCSAESPKDDAPNTPIGRSISPNFRVLLAGTALLIVIALSSSYLWKLYTNRSMRKAFRSKEVPEIGLTIGLRTERMENSVVYRFWAKPMTAGLEARMAAVLKTQDRRSLKFYVELEDSGNFELCKAEVAWHPDLASDGTFAGMSGQGYFPDCALSRYSKATGWNLQFHYPLTSDSLSSSQPESQPTDPNSRAATPRPVPGTFKPLTSQQTNLNGRAAPAPTDNSHRPSNIGIASGSSDDALTGADAYSGAIETVAGHTLRVTREAERTSLFAWQNGDSLKFKCAEQECLVFDVNRDETVHAHVIR